MAGSDLPRAARVTVACYGDSITVGTGTAPADSTKNTGYRYPLYNLLKNNGVNIFYVGATAGPADADVPQTKNDGVAGETTSQINTRLIATQPARPAEVVLIHAGTNDAQIATAAATWSPLIDTLILNAWNYGQRPGANKTKLVVVAQICDIASQHALVLQYNALLPALVAAHVAAGRNVKLVDMFTALGSASGSNFNLGSPPHPNATGYGIMPNVWAGSPGSGLLIDWNRSP